MNNIIKTNSIDEYAAKGLEVIHQMTPKHIALTGGTSPIPLYQSFQKTQLDWENIHLWWSDERLVPLDHPDSNYNQTLNTLNILHIPKSNVHAVPTMESPDLAAQSYTKEIQHNLDMYPQFDLIMLGVGPDGHIASLFPNTPEGQNLSEELVIPVLNSPKPPSQRITFTLKLINQARNILVTVKGKHRCEMIQNWFNGQPSSLPFTYIAPSNGKVHWLLLDED